MRYSSGRSSEGAAACADLTRGPERAVRVEVPVGGAGGPESGVWVVGRAGMAAGTAGCGRVGTAARGVGLGCDRERARCGRAGVDGGLRAAGGGPWSRAGVVTGRDDGVGTAGRGGGLWPGGCGWWAVERGREEGGPGRWGRLGVRSAGGRCPGLGHGRERRRPPGALLRAAALVSPLGSPSASFPPGARLLPLGSLCPRTTSPCRARPPCGVSTRPRRAVPPTTRGPPASPPGLTPDPLNAATPPPWRRALEAASAWP